MELPAALRGAAERELDGIALADLQRAADRLSERYRGEVRDGRLHLSADIEARAYLATRLPATYAALRDAFGRTVEVVPSFAPASLLDVGAGPGTALWAAADCWPGLAEASLIEASPAIRAVGERLSPDAGVARVTWQAGDATRDDTRFGRADLVTLAYALNEMPPAARPALIDRLWDATGQMLVVVEPGTPAGWRRILDARTQLLALGAHPVAPCAHGLACPLALPDWCHFSRRVARSRLHRLTKRGEVAWEDEKSIFFAASRTPPPPLAARVLAPPRAGSGRVELKLCRTDGTAQARLVTRREGPLYKRARRADWGDRLDERGAAADPDGA